MKEEQAVVSCKLCSRNLIPSTKHNKLILSNWTRHIITCYKAPKEHNHIEKYFLNLPSQADKPCTSKSANTAVHLHDSGPASAHSCARIQLDPMLAGCTMTVHVCGPIGNGRGSEARLVARFHTLIIRLPTPYELFGSSNNTVRLSTRPRTGCLDCLPGPVLIINRALVNRSGTYSFLLAVNGTKCK